MKSITLLAGIAALLMATSAAHSTNEPYCFVVLKPRDGFLALRADPGTKGEMVGKLHQGDRLFNAGCRMSIGCQKNWTYVFAPKEVDQTGNFDVLEAKLGYVSNKYIQAFACPEIDQPSGLERLQRALQKKEEPRRR
jgi:hypothetical protein